MPSRNILKPDIPESYYHIYARGANKQSVFLSSADYAFFISTFARHLSQNRIANSSGVPYPHLVHDIRLLSYCLMPNHFHLLVYQIKPGAMSALMRCIMTSYTRHFNLLYGRSGPLFGSTYKASRIGDSSYLQHISRYIHMNPRYWQRYPYSSLSYYIKNDSPEWLHTTDILKTFDNNQVAYLQFHIDYDGRKRLLDDIKAELADQ